MSLAPETNVKTIVEQGYDAIAPAYLAWSAPRPTTTRMAYIDKLSGVLQPGAAVLELGCGAGVPGTQKLVSYGLKVTGVDISAAQVALGREHVPEATFIQGDMMALDFEAGQFDAIVAFYSVFHLPKEEHGSMLQRMAGWLRDGGILLFNLGTDEGEHLIDNWMGAKMFSSSLGVDGNRKMLAEFGKGLIIEDEIHVEKVGRFDEKFHWVWAVKESQKVSS
ncbi:hypothetical protein M422DRAFT_774280 [Sphaerobolus stellatus SS14]|nr:hypothetical protein M422DRAFT_774280 [Sphaerobolus stellatus SS14]